MPPGCPSRGAASRTRCPRPRSSTVPITAPGPSSSAPGMCHRPNERGGREHRPPIVDDAAQEAEEHAAERQLLHDHGRQRDHDEGSPQHRAGVDVDAVVVEEAAQARHGRRDRSAVLTTRNACSPPPQPGDEVLRARPSSAAVILAASAAPARHGISARLTAVCASSGTTVLRRTRKPASSPTTATSATTSRCAVVALLNSSGREGVRPAGPCRRRSSRRVGRRRPRR